ncbi:MAG: DUF2029 domain-containing protein [Deltaproteobacteria bacterium]|nr:DUF2029 domain-containing protein [Deltaproteobacteria bacterium]
MGVAALALGLATVTATALVPGLQSLVGPEETGGVDLAHRVAEATVLWGGASPYGNGPAGGNAVYPPASYVLLGPLLLVPYGLLKWLWAGSIVLLLGGLGWGATRVAEVTRPEQLALVGLLPASIAGVAYGTQNGQIHVHVVAALLGGMALLLRSRPDARSDLLGSLLLLAALIKPTVAGPATLLLLARRDRWRVLARVGVAYLALTAVGCALAGGGMGVLSDWLFRAQGGADYGAGGSYGNAHAWSAMVGLTDLNAATTVVILVGFLTFALGRSAGHAIDGTRWAGVALAALVARVAVYHQGYDDTLLIALQFGLLAIVARRGVRSLAGGVLAALVLVQLPGRGWVGLGGAMPNPLEVARVVVWAAGAALCTKALADSGTLGSEEAGG